MKNTAFYILAVLVIVLCVVGACITAAPTEEEMQGVPHHMVGVADPNENFRERHVLCGGQP